MGANHEAPRTSADVRPSTLLNKQAAAQYLNVSRNTLYKMIEKGQLKVKSKGGKDCLQVSDLDKVRPFIGKYDGKRGHPEDPLTSGQKEWMDAARDALKVEDAEPMPEVTEEMTDNQVEDLFRRALVKMAIKGDVFREMAVMLKSPSEATRLKVIQEMNKIIFSQKKRVEHSASEQMIELAKQLEDVSERVRRDVKLLTGRTQDVIEGEVLPDIEVD
jgi:excisionase family DNA binding protein